MRYILFSAGVVVALSYGPYRIYDDDELKRLAPIRVELEQKRARMDELKGENSELRRHIDHLKNDTGAIEDIARDDLGLVYPGELVIQLENQEALIR